MKILERRPSRLKLRKIPLKWWVCGSIPVFLGLLMTSVFAKVTSLTCYRLDSTQKNCRLVTSGVMGRKSQEFPLNTLRSARLSKNVDTSRVVLRTNKGEIFFTPYQSDTTTETAKQEIVSRINNFVNDSAQKYFRVEQDDTWLLFGAGISITLGLLVITVPGVMESFSIDKRTGLLTLKRQTASTTQVTYHVIWDITDVQVEKKDNNYRIKIILTSGESIPLNFYASNNKKHQETTALIIRTFLNMNQNPSAQIEKIRLL